MARKILLADDSVTAQNMGRKILADAGYEVITVNNGSAALKRVTESKPDLIVLDVYMPGYSGLEVCQRLKDAAETAHIPVLLTVGKLEPFKPDEARRARADGHIVKPFEASELLSALARLEDRMVPTDGPRFTTTVSGVERFGGERAKAMPSDADTGWKSRLRFPLRKKKEEESEAEEAGASFRDFRKGKGNGASGDESRVVRGPQDGTPAPTASGTARQEPGLVPDIPRDITPEELDALSALAAKLDGPIPPPQPTAAATTSDARTEEKPAAAVAGHTEHASVAEFEVPPSAAETVGAPAMAEAAKNGLESTENADVSTTMVSADAYVETPAPVDQQDEPIFAVLPAAVSAEEATDREAPASEVPSVGLDAAAAEATVEHSRGAQAFSVVGVPPGAEQSKDGQAVVEQQSEGEIAKTAAEEVATAVGAGSVAAEGNSLSQPATESEVPAPTDEELAEALRLLTPSAGQADVVMPSHGTLVAAGQMLAEEAARTAGPNARWVAEAVALTQEESSMSLEEEMFRSFAPQQATTGLAEESAARSEATTGASAAGAAVSEATRDAEIAASTAQHEERESESKPAGEMAVASAAGELESVDKVPEVPTASDVGEESAPSGTFADATLQAEQEAAAVGEPKQEEAAESVAAAESVEDEKSSSDLGGDADMGKQGKSGSSKSGWHQIRKPAGASAASDVVEAAKQAGTDAEQEDSKAMAAAATADGGSAGPDASAIASIVDSVLADLRPKIVEEIAKKLGKR